METQAWDKVVDDARIEATTTALTANGFLPHVVSTKEDALKLVIDLIPAGSEVMEGSSRTLEEIGFIEYLKKGEHGWNNVHANILAESDKDKQAKLRKESVLSEFYLGSVHGLTETGEMLITSNTGSQLPHLVYTSQNIILVVGAQKISKDMTQAFERLNAYIMPLEDARIMQVYGSHTVHAKSLILHKENTYLGRKVHVVIVKEKLGY
jgi:L-lactate utilization protein LutC